MATILIADDHPVVRDGMKTMLAAVEGFKVAGCVSSGEEALRFVKTSCEPDVMLCDVRLGDMDGIDLYSRVRRFAPNVRAVFIAGMPNAADEARAKESGASAYLPKSVEMDDLIDAMRTSLKNDSGFISASTLAGVASPLSFRETQILTLLANGESKASVAEKIGVSFETVKTHVRTIRDKLGVGNTTAACAYAVSHGYISV